MATDPSLVAHRERARGALRALYMGELADIGRRRRVAMEEADRQIGRLALVILNAVDAGISVSEISRMANVSRPTVYALVPRARDKPRDIQMAVLQLTVDGATVDQIAKNIRWPATEVESLLSEFEERGWVQRDQTGGWQLMPAAIEAIERWDWVQAIDEYPEEPKS